MRAVSSIWLGVAASAATLCPQAAQSQVVTAGSTRIEAASQVRIMEDGPTALLLTGNGVTFAVSNGRNGGVAVSLPGFISQSGRSSGGLVIQSDGTDQVLTGTTLSSEALSVSVGEGDPADQSAKAARGVTMILAQFN